MRVLFVVPYTPNLIRTRPYNLIRHLTKRGHLVTVLTVVENEAEKADAQALGVHCRKVIALPLSRWRSLANCVRALPTRAPLQSVYSWQPALMRRLESFTNGIPGEPHFDVVHVEHLRGARYGLELKADGLSRVPVVWDSVDCISHLFRQATVRSKSHFGRIITRLELGRTERFEAQLVSSFDRTLVTSAVDQQALLQLAGEATHPKVTVLPNGVDLDYFDPGKDSVREPKTLVVSGKMSYHANVTMVLNLVAEIMPQVWSGDSAVKLWIVGKDPSPEIQSLAEHPNITVTGTVPDIRPYLRRATIAVAPLAYGAGIQNKILEAMACGTPVITSPQAVAALTVTPERDLLLAADAGSFAAAILDLLACPERQKQVGGAGRLYVEAHHNWSEITCQLEGIYADARQKYSRKA